MATSRADASNRAPQGDTRHSNGNDLFDYDAGLDDILASIETSADNNNTDASGRQQGSANPTNAGLGLDEEVKVTKKRQPIAKLDEGRLLSQAGIPRLRKSAKKLKFKGKGHEYSDALRLLSFYQLWLDDLYPRAKFADGLAMIEKLGHSKRLQIMRREWIDEGKPRSSSYNNSEPAELDQTRAFAQDDIPNGDLRNMEDVSAGYHNVEDDMDTDLNNLDGLDGAVGPQVRSIFGGDRASGQKSSTEQEDSLFVLDDENTQQKQGDDVDELDALLAEQDGAPSLKADGPQEEDFDDDLEAMNMYEL